MAAHTARVCGRCEDSRRLSTCEDRAHCAGLCNSTMHVDYNAFRHCSWCTTARNDISSRVTFAVRGTHRSQSMLPAAWRFRGTATSSTVRREPLANDDAPGSAHPQASGMPICSLSDPSACNCHLGPTICVELAAEELATASAQLPLDVQRFHVIPGISFSQTDAAQFGQRLPLAASYTPVRNVFWLHAPLVMPPSDPSTCICTSSRCAPL